MSDVYPLGRLSSGDAIGTILGIAPNFANTYWEVAGSVTFLTDGTTTDYGVPGAIAFATSDGTSSITTERMRVAANGNIGIGTQAPNNPLHVVGTSYFNGNVGIGRVRRDRGGSGPPSR